MHPLDPRRHKPLTAAFIAMTIPLVLSGTAAIAAKPAPSTPVPPSASLEAKHFAVIGDTPYGDAFTPIFGDMITQLSSDKQLGFIGHVGDIKTGSSTCTNEYNDAIKKAFDTAKHPLIYTPGDNEWTDCHRTKAGMYNPLERLTNLRKTFYTHPGKTLGATTTVTVSDHTYPENVRWYGNSIEYATLHVVGSNNGLVPWDGLAQTTPTADQTTEQQARMDAAITHLHETFADATKRNAKAVVLMQQADMFDPYTVKDQQYTAFTPLVQALVQHANTFKKPVYLINGDSHKYQTLTNPVTGDWATRYGVISATTNLTVITVPGEAEACDWLKFTVNPAATAAHPLTWEKKRFTNCPATPAPPKTAPKK